MITVKIVSGTYGLNTGDRVIPKGRMSEPFELEDAEAERLVSLGVAEIITEGVATGGNGEETNPLSVVTPVDNENGSDDENEGENDITGHLDVEQLKGMQIKELKVLAEDKGIDTGKFKVKDDYIQSIAAVEASATICDENCEIPPDISPEAPVV